MGLGELPLLSTLIWVVEPKSEPSDEIGWAELEDNRGDDCSIITKTREFPPVAGLNDD